MAGGGINWNNRINWNNMQCWKPLLFLVLAAVALRFFSFFPSVIDHDESTYIVIGKALLDGQTYFVDAADTKPVGIFLVYAFFEWLTGNSIFLIRLLTAVWVGLTGFSLFLLSVRVYGREAGARIGWAAGIMYLFLTSIWTFFGLSPNTELFFNLFNILAVWIAYKQPAAWRYALAGILLGVGFVIKYVTLFDAAALGFFMIWTAWRDKQPFLPLFLRLTVLGAAMALPFLTVIGYYYAIGELDTLWHYTFKVTGSYPVDKVWWKTAKFLIDLPLRFFPLTIMAVYSFREPVQEEKDFHRFLVLWILLDMVVIALPGKFFFHYFIQVMPAFSLLAASFFHPAKQQGRWLRRWPRKWAVGALSGLALATAVIQKIEIFDKPDYPRQVARYLRPLLSDDDRIYTGNYHHILYFLLRKQSPTPYVHSSLLWEPHHADALDVDLAAETAKIMEQRPKYVLLRKKYPENALSDAILNRYRPVHSFDDDVTLYEIINDPEQE